MCSFTLSLQGLGFIRLNSRANLRADAEKLGSTPTYGQQNALDDRRKSLNDRIITHQNRQDIYMAGVGKPDHPDRKPSQWANLEHAELALPSLYLRGSLDVAGLQNLAKLEAQLRRTVCNDALRMVRSLLGAKALTLKWKRANIRGERLTTRAEAALKVHNEQIARAQWRYNNSRDALMRLRSQESDLATYQVLKQDQLKKLKDYLEQDSTALGQGYTELPWLWRTAAVANKEEWQVEGESFGKTMSKRY
jgi:hypothetical protein